MTDTKKTRVVLSIDESVWQEFQDNLKKKGYPRGTASWIVQQKFEELNMMFEHVPESPQLDFIYPKK